MNCRFEHVNALIQEAFRVRSVARCEIYEAAVKKAFFIVTMRGRFCADHLAVEQKIMLQGLLAAYMDAVPI